jgi:guanylate kinase
MVIAAPSGGGKTTLCRNLLEADPRLKRVVTCTTRAPRAGEQDGVDYHFLGADEFEVRVGRGEFLEEAVVHGRRYGTPRRDVVERLRSGGDVLLNIDVQGAATVRARSSIDEELRGALVTVFLIPPSLNELEGRLRGRGTETEESVRERLAVARQEVACWEDFDYLLVSGTMVEDLRRMGVILEAERLRTGRVAGPVWSGAGWK